MKKLNVFLIQDKTKDIRWFEQTREAVEMSTFFKVTNNIDWRNTLNSQQDIPIYWMRKRLWSPGNGSMIKIVAL